LERLVLERLRASVEGTRQGSSRANGTFPGLEKGRCLGAEPQFDQRIYDASLSTLVQVVAEIEDEKQSAMLVGHNPGMEEMLALLTRETRHMPTAALARITLDCASWKEVGRGTGKLDWFVTPRELPED